MRLRRWLAGAAALLGGLAPFAPAPAVDVAQLARIVVAEEDHVSAIELAAWLRAAVPGVRVIDVRAPSEYAVYHIPGAVNVPVDRLAELRPSPDETIVVYSEAGVHGAQAWVFLRALGHRRVYFLRRGLHEWLDDVMSPAIAADASPAEREAFAQLAELSRHFGGVPRVLATRPTPTAIRGRSC